MLILGFDLLFLWILIKIFWKLGMNLLLCYYGNTKVKDSSPYKVMSSSASRGDKFWSKPLHQKIFKGPFQPKLLCDCGLAPWCLPRTTGGQLWGCIGGHSTAASGKMWGAGSDVGTEEKQKDKTPLHFSLRSGSPVFQHWNWGSGRMSISFLFLLLPTTLSTSYSLM